nr:hypothetical protein [Mesorhizobium erdmanii]
MPFALALSRLVPVVLKEEPLRPFRDKGIGDRDALPQSVDCVRRAALLIEAETATPGDDCCDARLAAFTDNTGNDRRDDPDQNKRIAEPQQQDRQRMFSPVIRERV